MAIPLESEEIKESESINLLHFCVKCWQSVLQTIKQMAGLQGGWGAVFARPWRNTARKRADTGLKRGIWWEGDKMRSSWTECPLAFLRQVSCCITGSKACMCLYLFSLVLWIMEHTEEVSFQRRWRHRQLRGNQFSIFAHTVCVCLLARWLACVFANVFDLTPLCLMDM